MKKYLLLIPLAFALAVTPVTITGCKTGSGGVAPGSDPLVVRAEQVETLSVNTFNLALTINDANRPFFATNLPAFAAFCEWLRNPVMVGTNILPQGLALVKRLDDLKQQYKANAFLSNSLLSSVISLESTNASAALMLRTATNSIPQ